MRSISPPPSEPSAFGIRSTAPLRRLGLLGEPVVVDLLEGELLLSGLEGGRLSCPAAEVERLRLGFEETKYSRVHVARIWRAGDERPLVLVPLDRPARAYGAAMRGFARAVAAAGGLARIERGLTLGGAMALPLSVLAVALAAGVLALSAWADRGSWGTAGFVMVMAALVASFAVRAFRLDVPRPVRSLEELERYLPGG